MIVIPVLFPHTFNVGFFTKIDWQLSLVMVLTYIFVHCAEALFMMVVMFHIRQMLATQLVKVGLAMPWTLSSAD